MHPDELDALAARDGLEVDEFFGLPRQARLDQVIAVSELDDVNRASAQVHRRRLAAILECDRLEVWKNNGSRDLATWLSARLQISNWAARRWINAAHMLPHLPETEAAFLSGTLSFEKTVELCRFATPESERDLVRWATKVSVGAIRARGDEMLARAREDVVEAHRNRFVRYRWDGDGHFLILSGLLPADQGAQVASALDRLARRMPDIVDENDVEELEAPDATLDERRADALVAMASRSIAEDQDPDRAIVVLHADLDILIGARDGGGKLQNGPVLHADTALRFACDCRLQTVTHDGRSVVGVGQTARIAPQWLIRLLRHRDGGCTFPGCEAKWFLQAHHIIHWVVGGPTDLDNLVLVCSFHHRLVHEHKWKVALGTDGLTTWFRPDGREFRTHARAGPSLVAT